MPRCRSLDAALETSMRRAALLVLPIGFLVGGLATPAWAQLGCRAPLKVAEGICVQSCPSGYLDRGRTCEPPTIVQGGPCNPPLKIAAGACVAACPGGYETMAAPASSGGTDALSGEGAPLR
jgi:hypothetical protein